MNQPPLSSAAVSSEDRVVFITGAGKGLGREMALAFASRGDRVALAGIEGIRETAARIAQEGGRALDLFVDLTRPSQIEEAVEQVLGQWGQIEVLVNNAAVEGPTAPLWEVSLQDWEQTLAVNLTGSFLCDRAIIPAMISRGSGCILHISSVAGLQAYPLRSPYAVSKWAVVGLTRTLAAELGPYNIRVNAICPGPVEGERISRVVQKRAVAEGRPAAEVEAEFRSRAALKRMVLPGEVVELVLFLASEQARSITGETIRVCAGYQL